MTVKAIYILFMTTALAANGIARSEPNRAAGAVQPAEAGNDVKAPVVAGGGEFKLKLPAIYRRGWVDLNKNGTEDVYENPAQPVEVRVEVLIRRMTVMEKIGQLEQKRMDEGSDQTE